MLGGMLEVTARVIRHASRAMFGFFALLAALMVAASCGDEDIGRSNVRGTGDDGTGAGGPEAQQAAPGKTGGEKQEGLEGPAYGDDDFVESERNRDPFRSYKTLFKAEAPQAPQRKVIMPTTAIEEMTLIAIISGVPKPKAMLKDPLGVGHIVERGMYLGRAQVVQASENVSMTLNWRVDRIRSNEVVLTREDPTDPDRPPLTRVIPLREEEAVASR